MIYLSIGVPVLFLRLGVDTDVTLMTLGVLSAAGTLYGVVSTWDKKVNRAEGGGES